MSNPKITIDYIVQAQSNENLFRIILRKEEVSQAQSGNSLLNLTMGGRTTKYVSSLPVDKNFFQAYGIPVDIDSMPEQRTTNSGRILNAWNVQGDNEFNNYLTRALDIPMITNDSESFPEQFPTIDLFITEQVGQPFWDGQDGKLNPSTKEYICFEGQKIYRNCEVKVAEDALLTDTFIKSDGSKLAGVKADALTDLMRASTELAD